MIFKGSHRLLRSVSIVTLGYDLQEKRVYLCGLVANDLGQDPSTGRVYIFINRARDKVKLLHWRSGGFVLYHKRLEAGTFEQPIYDENVGSPRLGYTQLVLLMDGVAITNITGRKRHRKA